MRQTGHLKPSREGQRQQSRRTQMILRPSIFLSSPPPKLITPEPPRSDLQPAVGGSALPPASRGLWARHASGQAPRSLPCLLPGEPRTWLAEF
eukprot:1160519-Pelagomonas_calceolata.AAC.3